MSTSILHGCGRLSNTPLPPSSEQFEPSLDSQTLRSAGDWKKVESDISRILIVDDNLEILKLVARMSEHLGYCPTTAEDAMDALYYLTKAHYDLVLTDYDMPLMDGYQLANQIKKKNFRTKVIIMTGHCHSDVTDLLDGSGIVDGMLLKPFNLITMKEKIELAGYASFR